MAESPFVKVEEEPSTKVAGDPSTETHHQAVLPSSEASTSVLSAASTPTLSSLEAPVPVSAGTSALLAPTIADPTVSGLLSPIPPPSASTEPAITTTEEEEPPYPSGFTAATPVVTRQPALIDAWRLNRFDLTPILSLLGDTQQQNEIGDTRSLFEYLLERYPQSGELYHAYLLFELSHDHRPQVESLFARAFSVKPTSPVHPLPHVPLYRAYLTYVRRANPPPTPATLTAAFEFVLSFIALDAAAGPVWIEYLEFLEAQRGGGEEWDEERKKDQLREVYSRALAGGGCYEGIEQVWRSYDAFEQGVNRVTAKKYLSTRSPQYMTTRSVLPTLRAHLSTLYPPSNLPLSTSNPLPTPLQLPHRPTWSSDDMAYIGAWKSYIEWEKSNPLELDDRTLVDARVAYALRKRAVECRFYPEVWFDASLFPSFESERGGWLQSGLEATPKSFLLNYSLALLHEEGKNFAEVHRVFEEFTNSLSSDMVKLSSGIDSAVSDALDTIPPPVQNRALTGGNNLITSPDDVDPLEALKLYNELREVTEKKIRQERGKEVYEAEKGLAGVWIAWMRFARRSEGIKSGRSVFGRARKSRGVGWWVFEASALMEYHCSKDASVATRIFELGMKVFGDKVEFVDRYLSFLIMVNDDQNARALFEKAATKFEGEEGRPVWERWARYEYLFGDYSSSMKLDQRIKEQFPTDSATKNLARKFSYNGIDEVARVDCGLGKRSAITPTSTTTTIAPSSKPVSIQPPSLTAAPAPPIPTVNVVSASQSVPEKRARPASPPLAEQPIAKKPAHEGYSGSPHMNSDHEHGYDSRRDFPVQYDSHGRPKLNGPPPPHLDTRPPKEEKKFGLFWLLTLLPPASQFDGPVFRSDDLLSLIANSSLPAIAPPPPPPEPRYGRGGVPRGEPDYSRGGSSGGMGRGGGGPRRR